MEASDMEKLRKPTRALWKYCKEDEIRFLLAGKKQIGTSPENISKQPPHKYRSILHRQRTKNKETRKRRRQGETRPVED